MWELVQGHSSELATPTHQLHDLVSCSLLKSVDTTRATLQKQGAVKPAGQYFLKYLHVYEQTWCPKNHNLTWLQFLMALRDSKIIGFGDWRGVMTVINKWAPYSRFFPISPCPYNRHVIRSPGT